MTPEQHRAEAERLLAIEPRRGDLLDGITQRYLQAIGHALLAEPPVEYLEAELMSADGPPDVRSEADLILGTPWEQQTAESRRVIRALADYLARQPLEGYIGGPPGDEKSQWFGQGYEQGRSSQRLADVAWLAEQGRP